MSPTKKITVPKHLFEAFDPIGEYKKVFVPEQKRYTVLKDFKGKKKCGICGKSYEFRLKINYQEKTCEHD